MIELGFLAALQAVIGGFDTHTVHQRFSGAAQGCGFALQADWLDRSVTDGLHQSFEVTKTVRV